jgi:hypothetical protein
VTITAPEPLQDALEAVGRLLDRLQGSRFSRIRRFVAFDFVALWP